MKSFGVKLFIFLSLWGCISEIDIAEKGEKRLIIGGVISNSPGERNIRIQESNGLDTLAVPVQARGEIFRDGEVWTSLVSPETGILQLPAEFVLQEGRSYQVEITLADGRVFQSLPQVLQAPYKPDSLSFQINTVSRRNDDGTTEFGWEVQLFAHFDLDEEELENSYFRWQIDNAWAFRDWRDTLCYLGESIGDFKPVIFSGKKVEAGNQQVMVANRPLGDPFLETYYFNTYLHRIDSFSFDYYDKSLRLVQNQGTIFDELPASIEGNIREIGENDSNKSTIGYIEFSLADTTRLRINRGDFTFQLDNPCEGWICNPYDTVCLCEDCGKWFLAKDLIETETAPPYWE